MKRKPEHREPQCGPLAVPPRAEFPRADLPWHEVSDMQSAIVDMIADGVPLRDTLDAIAISVERLAPPVLCSVLLVSTDGRHLRPGAAPSLPPEYTAAIDGLLIGDNVGSCGTAAFRKEPVIVTDIATDPKWAIPRDFVLSFGLRACWSLPIVREDGVVLGTIAMYYKEPRAPGERDWGLLEPAAKLVRLALARERRAEELAEAEARWQLAAEASELGTYDVDLPRSVATWSPQFRALLGLAPDVAPSLDLLLTCIHPDDRARFSRRVLDHSDPDATARDIEDYRIVRVSDGEERVIVWRGRVLQDAEGVGICTIGTIADVTEQRHYETALAEARDEAERANQAKSEFLASMSHELRTPLNAIIGFSDLIRHCTLGPISPGKYREYVDDIFSSGNHLLSLINDVLDMAKIEAGKRDIRLEEIAVAKTVNAALVFVDPQARAAGLTLDSQIDRDLALMADERALSQVLINLLSNAVKFTKPGGRVTIFANRLPGGGAALGVEDTGIGMNGEGLAKALEPFGQVDERFTVEGRGTGLGLPLVKALVKAQGAAFRIESELHKGTRAWAEFPASAVIDARAVA